MNRSHLLLTSLAAGLALASAIYLLGFSGSRASKPEVSDDRASDDRPSDDRPSGLRHPSEDEAAPPSSSRPSSARDFTEEPDASASEPRSQGSTDAPGQMRRALQDKFGRPLDASDPPPELPQEYVKRMVQEQMVPLAQSCYEDIAKGMSGKMTMSVTVIGDADIGGVVDNVDVDDVDASVAGDLTECVRQAAYAMEFEAPEEGEGLSEFTFSMAFWPDPESKRPK